MQKTFLSNLGHDIGIDLGTANTLVYVRGRGIVINEPSVVALNLKTGKILAIGREAREMVGKTPAHIVATRPLVDGVISDFEITEQMLRHFIRKVQNGKFFTFPRPRVVIAIPYGVTEVERKAVEDAARNAGAREVYLIEEPMAASIGARLPVQEAAGNIIVDIGGGTTEVAVISLGGIVRGHSLRVAGDKLNADIIRYAQEEYNLLLGERTAEEIKITVGSALPLQEPLQTMMRGRDLVTGLPKELVIDDENVRRALAPSVETIVKAICLAIEETPPELLGDIMRRGIMLAGGGSLLRRLDDYISRHTSLSVIIAEDPLTAVARGTGIALEQIDKLRDVFVPMEYQSAPR